MAFTKSGLYLHTFQSLLNATSLTGGPINLTALTNKISLLSSSVTDGSSPVNFSTATSNWVNTNEVTGTNWATTGVLLSAANLGGSGSTTYAEGTTGSLRYNWSAGLSIASTTITGAFGCIIYADPITAPADLVDAMLVAICFGASYSTSNGTFGITPSGTGI